MSEVKALMTTAVCIAVCLACLQLGVCPARATGLHVQDKEQLEMAKERLINAISDYLELEKSAASLHTGENDKELSLDPIDNYNSKGREWTREKETREKVALADTSEKIKSIRGAQNEWNDRRHNSVAEKTEPTLREELQAAGLSLSDQDKDQLIEVLKEYRSGGETAEVRNEVEGQGDEVKGQEVNGHTGDKIQEHPGEDLEDELAARNLNVPRGVSSSKRSRSSTSRSSYRSPTTARSRSRSPVTVRTSRRSTLRVTVRPTRRYTTHRPQTQTTYRRPNYTTPSRTVTKPTTSPGSKWNSWSSWTDNNSWQTWSGGGAGIRSRSRVRRTTSPTRNSQSRSRTDRQITKVTDLGTLVTIVTVSTSLLFPVFWTCLCRLGENVW